MKTRDEVLSQAAEECLKDFYNYAVPKVSWEDFLKENQEYTKKYNEWEKLENRPPIKEFCGPRPYEFYYLPSDILKDIVLYYVHAYKIDAQQELLDIIKILKDYCKNPIVDKYIKGENGFPGHRGYDHPDNLEKEINKIIDDEDISQLLCNKFFKFLDMAGEFFNWNGELNSFYTSVYLGPSPNSNKEAVIDNWKQYRNKEIEINDEKYNDEEQNCD